MARSASRAAASARHWLLPTLAGGRREWLAADVVAGLWAGAVVVPGINEGPSGSQSGP
jgi:hypothetical protein